MTRTLPLLMLVVLTACGGAAGQQSAATQVEPQFVTTTTTPVSVEESSDDAEESVSELASRTQELGSALLGPVRDPSPVPAALSIESLDVSFAPVVDVGVESNGEMEIPGASQVGWYRFGPSPGEAGSAVFAAHIAFNGRDGIFRDLDDIEVGDVIEISYDDGSTKRFRITETAQYSKDELPVDRVFAKDGPPELTLITCGGDFNRSLRSYSDNVVAYAAPIDA